MTFAGRELILATRNPHKLRELSGMLPGWRVVALPDDVVLPPEDGETFAENALGKARAAAAAGGRPAIADDSGICVRALDGAPGVRSARYAGEHATDADNVAKLLAAVGDAEDRHVEYVCAIAIIEPGTVEHVFEGRCGGTLTGAPRGDGGFGYDPIVVPRDLPDGRTMAELAAAEKDAISHRGRAVRQLVAWLGAAAEREAAQSVADGA